MATIASIAIPALVGAYGIYSSKQASKKTRSQKDYESLISNNTRAASDYGTKLLDRSGDALGPVYDWYNKLATGDRESLMELYGPEIANLSQGAQRAYQTSTELSPRSGIATERTQRIPMDNARALADMIRGARPEGIRGLQTLGTNWASLGLQGLGQGSGGAGQLLGLEGMQRDRSRQAGMDAGESAYALYRMISDAVSQRSKGTGSQASYSSFWGTEPSSYRDFAAGGKYGYGGMMW